jgi:hypothetical protein
LERAQQLRLERLGVSVISSRNSVPPSAISNSPSSLVAPVNEPFL